MKFRAICTIQIAIFCGILANPSCRDEEASFTGATPDEAQPEKNDGDAQPKGKYHDFKFGGPEFTVNKQLPANFLFVMDNSSSMSGIYTKVKSGIMHIGPEKYPDNSKIAVMTGMAGDFDDLSQAHPYIWRGSPKNPLTYYKNIELEPGFLSFVNAASIARFKAITSQAPRLYKDAYSKPGCNDSWFAPGQKAADGTECIEAALQNPMTGVGCEPNIIAFQQLLEKNVGQKLFRTGGFLHVIFVSDEVHPGCSSTTTFDAAKNQAFIDKCKSFPDLKKDILANTRVAGVKFHGMVRSEQDDLKAGGCGYINQLIKPSGGVNINSLDRNITDYSPIIEKIATSSVVESVYYQLPKVPKRILKIFMDGKEFTGKRTITDDGVLILDGINLKKSHKFRVYYEL